MKNGRTITGTKATIQHTVLEGVNRSSISFRAANGLCPNVLIKQPAAKLSDPNTITAQVVKLTGKKSAWLAPNHAVIIVQSRAWSRPGYIQSRNLTQFA